MQGHASDRMYHVSSSLGIISLIQFPNFLVPSNPMSHGPLMRNEKVRYTTIFGCRENWILNR